MKTLVKSFTKKDFRLEWFSGTGAGGQYRNKHQNCCRITHIESGLSATGQASRSRVENQRHAFTQLAHKITAQYTDGQTERARAGTDEVRVYKEPLDTCINRIGKARDSYSRVVIDGKPGHLIDENRKARAA